MFKNIAQFWKGKDFMTDAFENFKSMLNSAHEMFDSVCKKLIYNEDTPSLKDKIYDIDEKINASEKNIRKRVIEHLSFQPTVDITVSLLLMSVVKDAERLGDYCKNLYEIIEFLEKPLDKAQYEDLFNGIDKELSHLFEQTEKAFIESDESRAAKSWKHETRIVKQCDEIVEKLAKSSIPVNEAVSFTLMARYFKRIAAHLTNIATSVILPLTELDYFDERRKNEASL